MHTNLLRLLCIVGLGLMGCRPVVSRSVPKRSGVRAVRDQVVVLHRVRRPDVELRREITARIARDLLLDGSRVHVRVKRGAVSLTGRVGSEAERQRANFLAWTDGVQLVDSTRLLLAPRPRDKRRRSRPYLHRPDAVVLEAVRQTLSADPRVGAGLVRVRVSAGTVRLVGCISDPVDRRAVLEDARSVVGVWKVVSQVRTRCRTRPEADR